jgi:hypothetical protein
MDSTTSDNRGARSKEIRNGLLFLLAAALFALSALYNGQPLFYPDTTTYVRGTEMGVARLLGPARTKAWMPAQHEAEAAPSGNARPEASGRLKPLSSVEDKVVLAGRSVYYGALVYAGYFFGSLWLVVAVQALCVTYVLQLLLVRIWRLPAPAFVAIVAALALLTPIGAYAGFLMPDVFAPLVILCSGILAVYWRQLARPDRVALGLLLLYAITAHSSHLVLALAMLALMLVVRNVGRRPQQLAWPALVVVAACVVGGLAAEWAFGRAVTAAIGAPPMRLPHPAAHLIDLGPGTTYLKANCPAAGFAACKYVQNYPTNWEDFLFSTDPHKGAFALADPATKRQLSDEQLKLVFEIVKSDPVGVVRGLTLETLTQLASFRQDLWGVGPGGISRMYEGRVPDEVLSSMKRTVAAGPSSLNRLQTATTYAAVIASLVWLLWWSSARNGTNQTPPGYGQLALLVVAGVIANAVICAVLASAMDRFQARVIWLVPLLAAAGALSIARSRRQSAAPGPATSSSTRQAAHASRDLSTPIEGNPV